VTSISPKPPGGWRAIGIFLLAGSAAATLAGITLIAPRTPVDRIWVLNPHGHTQLLTTGKFVGILFPILGVTLAAAGFGWLKVRYWGWILAVMLIGGNLLGDTIRLAQGEWLSGAVGVLLAGALFLYIISAPVRGFFRRPPET